MKKWFKIAATLVFLAFTVVPLALWLKNSSPSSSESLQSNDESMENVAAEYADENSTLEQVLEEIDSLAQNGNMTDEQAEWLKTRVAELRTAASFEEPPKQPETFDEYTEYFANFDSQTLNDVRTAQNLYDHYWRNPGPDAPITQSTLQVLNQAKLKENGNLAFIDSEINKLVTNGTLTDGQGVLLRERVHQLRLP